MNGIGEGQTSVFQNEDSLLMLGFYGKTLRRMLYYSH